MSIQTTSPRPRVDPQKVLTNACGDEIEGMIIRSKGSGWFGWDLDEVGDDIGNLVQESKRIAFQLGHLYRVAYKLCPAGEFKQWVQKLGFHRSTQAYAYMKVYKVCLGREELVQNIPNTILLKMCEGTFPEDLREQILSVGLAENEYGHPNVKVREIAEAGAKVASGEWSFYGPEVRGLLRQSREEQTEKSADLVFHEFKKCLGKTINHLRRLREDDPTSEIQKKIDKGIDQLELTDDDLCQMGW
ncbi:MAG: hypothetical protein GWP14_06895 [Actinobacteria bacterium]|nr:hypothetical protein [Actinomycetota bacterium]